MAATSSTMILFRSCPRCTGDRSLEQDFYGWYVLCLSCGFVTYPEVGMEDLKPVRTHRQTA